jgi:ADP-ribose pyrophosphatase
MKKPKFTKSDVEVINQNSVFNGFFKLDEYQFRHKLFAGGYSGVIKREIFERGESACVLLWDMHRDKVVLIEQFRVGALEHPSSPWLIEVVAGMIEPGESPDAVVYREAQEEAGVVVTRLAEIGSYLATPGGSTERVWLFVGEVDSEKVSGIHGLDTENEDIRVDVFDREEVTQNLFNSRLDNSATIICLQWLALNKEMLLEKWK